MVIGAGCAGLSLATQLAKLERMGSKVPSTILVDRRAEYVDDRTWCFWEPPTSKNQGSNQMWDSWEFSDGNNRVIHCGNSDWAYHYTNALDFYQTCIQSIEQSKSQSLHLNQSVKKIKKTSQGYLVSTTNRTYIAKNIVDTRPWSAAPDRDVLLNQIFYGLVIDTSELNMAVPNRAMLMTDMSVDEYGFKFNYILPLSKNRILIEVTRFTAHDLAPESLAANCYALSRNMTKNKVPCILRVESGNIPMGLGSISKSSQNYVYSGVTAGAARASTGYAFQRIGKWAKHCAVHLVEHGNPCSAPKDPTLIHWMDTVFLQTIKRNPKVAPKLFMSLAENLDASKLVRFLTDKPTYRDLFSVMTALPVKSLLKSAIIDLSRRAQKKYQRVREA